MTTTKNLKKQQAQNLQNERMDKETAAKRVWLRGYKTPMEQDIMSAAKKNWTPIEHKTKD